MRSEKQEFLTVVELANFLNVSVLYAEKLADAGAVESTTVVGDMLVTRSSALAYRKAQNERSETAMGEMIRLSQEMGLYDMELAGIPEAPNRKTE